MLQDVKWSAVGAVVGSSHAVRQTKTPILRTLWRVLVQYSLSSKMTTRRDSVTDVGWTMYVIHQ